MSKGNIDIKTVNDFGDEWSRFDQSVLSDEELSNRFDEYFSVFPFEDLSNDSIGFDVGCGSGRWAKLMAPRVGLLHCIDPSSALDMAKKNLKHLSNCLFYRLDIDSLPMHDNSMDFGYSLGVLHHVPNTSEALNKCVEKLKPGAPFLVYLYYAFDNRPLWFRFIWMASNFLRFFIAKLPFPLKYLISQFIAVIVYWPLTRIALMIEKFGYDVDNIPLSYYRKYSFYSMRTDALDRFGTRLEHRHTKEQIRDMMKESGLENIVFSSAAPYWCAMGYKKENIN